MELREEVKEALKVLQLDGDAEYAHQSADDVLRNLLISLGYADVVDEYDKIKRWFR